MRARTPWRPAGLHFATPVLGGQLTIGAAAVPGNVGLGINATLTGPRGNRFPAAHRQPDTWADIYYLGTLKWNHGVNNHMWYVFGNIPSGTYDSTRLANLSIGYVAVDSGFGYTYLNPKTGHEFSVVAGFSYSGTNKALDYRNGIDFHVDWAVSQFIGKSVHVGIVGYVYQQVTGDSGTGAKLGDNKGRAIGIGPQIGFFFPAVRRLHRLSEHPRLRGRRHREPAEEPDIHGDAGLHAGRAGKPGDAARAKAPEVAQNGLT